MEIMKFRHRHLRRAICALLTIVMCIMQLPTTALYVAAADENVWTDYAAEEVTPNEDGVYEISSAAELAWLAKGVNDGSIEQYEYDENWDINYYTFRLTKDINLSAHLWVPIGVSNSYQFRAIFDGAGHTISGMQVGTEEDPYNDGYYAGLFGRVSGSITDV